MSNDDLPPAPVNMEARLRGKLHELADLVVELAMRRAAKQDVEPSANQSHVPTPCPESPNDYLTPTEYAARRGVSRTTIFAWMRAGLPSVKQGASRRIRWREADAFLDAGRLSKAKHRAARPKRGAP